MNTYKTHIEPAACFIHAVFSNGSNIKISVDPTLSDNQIFDHYIGRDFKFYNYDDYGRMRESKTSVVRLLITRENEIEKNNIQQLKAVDQ